MWRARHLQDDRLYECYVAEQTGERVDPRAADHLADCQPCQARFAEISAFMGGLRAEADAELDAAYPADALHAQQSSILRRIEHLGHAARVISFPTHQASPASHGESWLVAPRWLVAAAAAGLVVGVGVGTVLRSPLAHPSPAKSAVLAPAVTQSVAQPAAVEDAAAPSPVSVKASADSIDANDEFFSALGLELQRSQTPELLAFDDLTPHAREIRFNTATYR